jgi:hypothetical protein
MSKREKGGQIMGHQTYVASDGIRSCEKHDVHNVNCFGCHVAGGGSDD